jgi:hypothetical protein
VPIKGPDSIRTQLFKLAVPAGFKPENREGTFVAEDPLGRQIQAGRLPWAAHIPITIPVVQFLIRMAGPQPFVGGLEFAALRILSANAEPGSLHITQKGRSLIGGNPALFLNARYTKAGTPRQVYSYFSFSRAQPVYLFLIAGPDDRMDWAGQVAERMELFR